MGRNIKKKFDGKVYTLISNRKGTSYTEAQKIKKKWIKTHFVRVDWSGAQPYIYPKGRYFVYVRDK